MRVFEENNSIGFNPHFLVLDLVVWLLLLLLPSIFRVAVAFRIIVAHITRVNDFTHISQNSRRTV